jgi:thiamine-monophosphate kinase
MTAPWLHPDGDASLVVTTDLLLEGIHFSDTTMGPEDLGWRAAAANLSDLAAMGCHAVVGLTVGLAAPKATPWAWVEGVYGGLSQALARYGGDLLGGDCSGGPQRLLAITALGRLNPVQPIRRGAGRPGDWLVSSGDHGLSRLGLALLQGELELPKHRPWQRAPSPPTAGPCPGWMDRRPWRRASPRANPGGWLGWIAAMASPRLWRPSPGAATARPC